MSTIYFKDYKERDVGSMNPENKKAVLFKFSIGNDQEQNEYVVDLRWSFTSGKQSIKVNNRDHFFFKSGGASILNEKVECQDGMKLQVLGMRHAPNGRSIRLFDLVINDVAIFSACPFFGGGRGRRKERTVLDLVYTNHPLRQHGNQQCAGSSPSAGAAPQPAAAPVQTAEAPDLLLDFNPIPAAPPAQAYGSPFNAAPPAQGYGNPAGFDAPPAQRYASPLGFDQTPAAQGYASPVPYEQTAAPPAQGYASPMLYEQTAAPPAQGYASPMAPPAAPPAQGYACPMDPHAAPPAQSYGSPFNQPQAAAQQAYGSPFNQPQAAPQQTYAMDQTQAAPQQGYGVNPMAAPPAGAPPPPPPAAESYDPFNTTAPANPFDTAAAAAQPFGMGAPPNMQPAH